LKKKNYKKPLFYFILFYFIIYKILKFINIKLKNMRIFFTYNFDKLVNFPISDGIEPVNWLSPKFLFL